MVTPCWAPFSGLRCPASMAAISALPAGHFSALCRCSIRYRCIRLSLRWSCVPPVSSFGLVLHLLPRAESGMQVVKPLEPQPLDDRESGTGSLTVPAVGDDGPITRELSHPRFDLANRHIQRPSHVAESELVWFPDVDREGSVREERPRLLGPYDLRARDRPLRELPR